MGERNNCKGLIAGEQQSQDTVINIGWDVPERCLPQENHVKVQPALTGQPDINRGSWAIGLIR